MNAELTSPDTRPPDASRAAGARRPPGAPSAARAAAVLADPRWAAVLARDAASDGRFFYSVRSTGVFCRPSCAARAPKPANVAFHDSIEAARAAGFRPCLRCRPEGETTAQRHAAIVAAACRALDEAVEAPSLDELAASTGLAPHHFHKVFRAIAGVTPRAYHAARRAERMRSALAAGAAVTPALHDAGYGSSGRFHAHSRSALGMTPSAYRRGGSGATVRFAIGRCTLGEVLVACSETGVCAILLGDDAPALLRELQERFPRADLVGADARFEELVGRVVALVESPGASHELPLDLRGTAFQVRVWEALTRIPLGQTTTYSALADSLGIPAAVRAVAGACAANPFAVAIPCHRVVRTDGSLAGYRWGLERKRALLEREAELSCGNEASVPPTAAVAARRRRRGAHGG